MISYSLRAARWTPFLVLASVATLYFLTQWHTASEPSPAVGTMRVVTVLLALACCAALDDPAATLLAAAPVQLWRRRARQAAVTLVPVTFLWLIAFLVSEGGTGPSAGGLALEAGTLLALVLTATVLAQRVGIPEPSRIVGALAVGVVLVLLSLPPRLALFTAPDDPAWPAAHQRWGALLVVLVALGAYALRDPAARTVRRLARRVPAEHRYPEQDDVI